MTPDGLPPRPDQAPTAAISLEPRRRELAARVAELQWDLGGLAYEMAIRDHIRVDLLVQRAAAMQAADAELGEIERMIRMEHAGAAGSCPSCAALHSRGAVYCWQCGQTLVDQVPSRPAAAAAVDDPTLS
ncbi:MAG TPA: hypothetical protein VHW26_09235 [Solirubrobacteraceae bacterium]|nr:hypothetical protein [Solirubrobacteraceae bacterium]